MRLHSTFLIQLINNPNFVVKNDSFDDENDDKEKCNWISDSWSRIFLLWFNKKFINLFWIYVFNIFLDFIKKINFQTFEFFL